MSTRIRYFPRSGLVLVRGSELTITFRVKERWEINGCLMRLGYARIENWNIYGDCDEAYTVHLKDKHIAAA